MGYEPNEIQNRVHDRIAGIDRVSLFPSSSRRIIETPDADTTYIGTAHAGASVSDTAAWLIEKVDTSVADTTSITHAVDSWDNRASADYS